MHVARSRFVYLVLSASVCLAALLSPLAFGERPHGPIFVGSCVLVAALLGYLLGAREDGLRALSSVDALTGLYNRRHFETELQRELKRSHRDGTPLSLLILDLDQLKAVNDALGHGGGDRALCAVADALRHTCRSTDLAARWGGDEFVVVAPSTTEEQARALAERIAATVHLRSAARRTVIELGAPVPTAALTVTIGIATADGLHQSLMRYDALFTTADRALYDAKAKGPGSIEVAEGVVRTLKPRPALQLVAPGAPHPVAAARR